MTMMVAGACELCVVTPSRASTYRSRVGLARPRGPEHLLGVVARSCPGLVAQTDLSSAGVMSEEMPLRER